MKGRSEFVRGAARTLVVCAALIATVLAAQSADSGMTPSPDAAFIQQSDAAMARMMAGMQSPATGDVDRDFVDRMVPHHQGAIDMAVAVLRYGHNEQIRRLAQEIIIDQQQEIAAMRLAVGEPLPAATAAPTMPGMDMRAR
jgi:uncharacterized protein (DUF305 family)